jgi:NitT/TauT family transport system ATP-binding protein
MQNEPAPFLEIREIHTVFPGPNGSFSALKNVSLTLRKGEFVCLIGPSGCGKSTLLRIIAGLLTPTEGEVRLEGAPLTEPGRRVGLVFQQPTLLPWRTVADNVALPLELGDMAEQERKQRIRELLRTVGLTGFESEYPHNLSGGMAQRAAIARAMAQNPEILLLDEPFGSLDALTRERMGVELLRIWQAYQRTVVMVTHSVEEAALLADRVVVLTPLPGRILDVIDVTLPRPRNPSLLGDPELQAVAQRLRETLSKGEQRPASRHSGPLPLRSRPAPDYAA